MIRFPRRWSIIDKINYLQRKIILNSISYYEFDKSYISDKAFDDLSHQLVSMQAEYVGNIEADTEYGYMMYDFDGSTGFDLYGKLNHKDRDYLYNITEYYVHHKEKPKEKKKETVQKRRLF